MLRLGRRRDQPLDRTLRLGVLGLLALAALLNLGLAVVLLEHPEETRYGEALIYGHAARLLHGEPLYQPLNLAPFTVANYTPLYYWLVAAVHAEFGPGFFGGRLISLASGLMSALLVGRLTWSRTRAGWPAVAAGLLFLGLGAVGPVPWTAAYKEDVFGVMLALGSVVALDGAVSRARIVSAAVLAAGAILTKQSLLGPALAGMLWLLVCRPGAARWFGLTVALVVGGTAVALEASTRAFIANTIGGNGHQPFDSLTLQHNLSELATFQAVPTLLALVALALLGTNLRNDLVALNWLGALIPLIPFGAIGADYNYWLELAALSAVLSVSLVWQRHTSWTHALGLALLGANVAFGVLVIGRQVLAHPEYVLPAGGDAAVLASLVERVRGSSSLVLADPLDVLVLADRPIELEPILYSLQEQDGSWDARAMVSRVCAGDVGLVVLGYPLGEARQRFPVSVAEALERTFVLETTVSLGGHPRYVLVRDPRARCG